MKTLELPQTIFRKLVGRRPITRHFLVTPLFRNHGYHICGGRAEQLNSIHEPNSIELSKTMISANRINHMFQVSCPALCGSRAQYLGGKAKPPRWKFENLPSGLAKLRQNAFISWTFVGTSLRLPSVGDVSTTLWKITTLFGTLTLEFWHLSSLKFVSLSILFWVLRTVVHTLDEYNFL